MSGLSPNGAVGHNRQAFMRSIIDDGLVLDGASTGCAITENNDRLDLIGSHWVEPWMAL